MRFVVIALVTGGACGDRVADDPPDALTIEASPQLPPQGHAALKAWLAEGHYLAWACEDAPHPARPPGAHGTNRICSNAALSTSTAGAYPDGAASVKELVQDDRITGYAVGSKLASGRWYWYEAYGDSVIADGTNKALCDNCHAGAPRDAVFTQVR